MTHMPPAESDPYVDIDDIEVDGFNGRFVRHIALHRPEKYNAITQGMYAVLAKQLNQANDDNRCAAIVLSGVGEHFCAGNDIADFAGMAQQLSGEFSAFIELPVYGFLMSLVRLSTPLIVCAQGNAVGIGFTLMLHAHFVYVTDDACLSAPFTKLGLVPEAGSSQLLPAIIGMPRAMDMLVAGATMSGMESVKWGLANECFANQSLALNASIDKAMSLAKLPACAVQASLRLLKPAQDSVEDCMKHEAKIFFERLHSSEAQAAFRAFLSKK